MPSAYFQLDLPEKYRERLSFTTQWGTFMFLRTPPGLKTAASRFQGMADAVKEEINLPGIAVYQDDWIIAANSFDEMTSKVEKLLQAFKKNNLTLNFAKCTFHRAQVNFLGFNIQNNRIKPISTNINKINAFPPPKTKRQVKKFLGLCGFYRSLIPSFAQISEPLVALTSPKSPFKWESSEQAAFNQLQSIFFNEPFLQQPDYNKPFYLNTDASTTAISAILMQKSKSDSLLPVAYFSKSLRGAEKKYPPIKLELMAIVKGVNAFRNILYGRHFYVVSDSKPLKHYSKTTSPANIVTRWLVDLGQYSYTFQHLPGKENMLADFFSRTPTDSCTDDLNTKPDLISSNQILPIVEQSHEIENTVNALDSNRVPVNPPKDPLLEISTDTIFLEQLKDSQTLDIINDINSGNGNKQKKYFICPQSHLLMFIVQRESRNHCSSSFKVVIPRTLREKCLRIHHLAHFGIEKTYQSISRKFYWNGMYRDVVSYVNSCETCIISKPQRIPSAPLQNSPIPQRPGQILSLDFVGPFDNGYHILTAIDHFTKHLKLYPIKNITAMNTVKAIFDYVCTFGRPEVILTDNGKQFTAHIFEEFNDMLGIKLRHTTVAHPEANAVSERINFSIKSTIKALMQDGFTFLNAVLAHQSIYNNTFHSTIKASPNRVHFGRALSGLTDTFAPSDANARLDVHADYHHLSSNLNKLYEQIHQNLLNYQNLQNERHLLKSRLRTFKLNDIVYLAEKSNFRTQWKGPFKVVELVTDVIVKIQHLEDAQAPVKQIHINRLRIAPSRGLENASQLPESQLTTSSPANSNDTQQSSPVQNNNRNNSPSSSPNPVQSILLPVISPSAPDINSSAALPSTAARIHTTSSDANPSSAVHTHAPVHPRNPVRSSPTLPPPLRRSRRIAQYNLCLQPTQPPVGGVLNGQLPIGGLFNQNNKS